MEVLASPHVCGLMYEGAADFDSNLKIRWDLEPLPCLPPIGIREHIPRIIFGLVSSNIICSQGEDLKADRKQRA